MAEPREMTEGFAPPDKSQLQALAVPGAGQREADAEGQLAKPRALPMQPGYPSEAKPEERLPSGGKSD